MSLEVHGRICAHGSEPTHICLPHADLLNVSFAVGNPEAGWLPPPESKQPERDKAERTGHADPVGRACEIDPAAPHDAPLLGKRQQQQQQQQPGKVSEKAPTAPEAEHKGAKQTAAGGGGIKSGKLSSAPVPGLHSTDQLMRRSDGGQPGPGREPRDVTESVTDEQRLFGLVLSSPSSMDQSRGGVPSQPSGGSMPGGGDLAGAPLGKTRSLPKTVKGRAEQTTERPDRSVRSDSAPQRGSSGLSSKPHARLSDTALGPSELRPAATESKVAHASGKGSHAREIVAHRPATGAHAGQPQHRRMAGKVPAVAAAAGKKHGTAAVVLVPMADDEQPGGFSDRNGRHHASQKREAGHECAPPVASAAPAGHKSGKQSGAAAVRSNGFHARPSVHS